MPGFFHVRLATWVVLALQYRLRVDRTIHGRQREWMKRRRTLCWTMLSTTSFMVRIHRSWRRTRSGQFGKGQRNFFFKRRIFSTEEETKGMSFLILSKRYIQNYLIYQQVCIVRDCRAMIHALSCEYRWRLWHPSKSSRGSLLLVSVSQRQGILKSATPWREYMRYYIGRRWPQTSGTW